MSHAGLFIPYTHKGVFVVHDWKFDDYFGQWQLTPTTCISGQIKLSEAIISFFCNYIWLWWCPNFKQTAMRLYHLYLDLTCIRLVDWHNTTHSGQFMIQTWGQLSKVSQVPSQIMHHSMVLTRGRLCMIWSVLDRELLKMISGYIVYFKLFSGG